MQGVVAALSQERAPVLPQVPEQFAALHAVTVIGSLMTTSPSAS